MKNVSSVLLFALFSLSAQAEVTIGTPDTASTFHYQKIAMTPAALQEAMDAPQAKITQADETQATQAAALRGVVLPPTSESSPGYGHPWFIVKVGIGLPGMIDADVEIYVHDNWTVEAGAGTGLIANVYTAGVRWRPDALCWGCQGSNLFSIGLGIDALTAGTQGEQDILIAGVADAQYIHRFAEHFGWVIGTKLGIGPTFGFTRYAESTGNPPNEGPGSTPPPPPTTGVGSSDTGSYHLKNRVEPGLTFFLYTGFQF